MKRRARCAGWRVCSAVRVQVSARNTFRPFDPVGQPMPFASQPKPKLLHYEVAGFVRAFFESSRFCATIFWVQHSDPLLSSMISSICARPTTNFIGSSNAGSSRRGAAGFRLVQKMATPNKETEEDWVLGALLPSRRWSGALNVLAGSVLPCPKQKRAGQGDLASTLLGRRSCKARRREQLTQRPGQATWPVQPCASA